MEQNWQPIELDEEALAAVFAEDYLGPLVDSKDSPFPMVVQPEAKVYTNAIKTGLVPAKAAKKIDIKLYVFRKKQISFTWECKLICDREFSRRPGKEKYRNNLVAYASEGILRFINGDYSAILDDAGMLGFVLGGEVSTIVSDINDSMARITTHRWSQNDHLSSSDPIRHFQDVYFSRHSRTDGTTLIRLHHLFFTFDWPT